jgi:putative ABC transport system permease protein
MNIKRSFAISLNVLFGHKLRTLLSAMAVGVGVAAVVMMVGAGKSLENETAKKIENMGTDLVTIQAGKFKNVGGRTRQVSRFTTLTPKDVRAIERKVPSAKRAGGIYDRQAQVAFKNVRTNTTLFGVEPSVFEIWRLTAVSGRLFNEMDDAKMARVCVIGKTVQKNLFQDFDPVGEIITVGKIPLKIVGVSSERGQDLSGDDLDNSVYVPLSTAMKRIFDVTFLDSILIQAQDKQSMETIREEAREILRKNHRLKEGKDDDFTILDQSQLLSTEMETQSAFSYLIAIVAGLSLLTGGIGIFAVMLISLRERKREVGLRRAIGARHKDILVQFLFEASALSVMGGIVGTIIGLIGCCLISKINGWETILPVSTIMAAFAFSILTGIVFGIYPANLASKLEPAEALRAGV